MASGQWRRAVASGSSERQWRANRRGREGSTAPQLTLQVGQAATESLVGLPEARCRQRKSQQRRRCRRRRWRQGRRHGGQSRHGSRRDAPWRCSRGEYARHASSSKLHRLEEGCGRPARQVGRTNLGAPSRGGKCPTFSFLVHDAQAHSQIGEDELGLHSITPSMSRSVEGALSVRCQGRTDSKRAVRAAVLCWQRSLVARVQAVWAAADWAGGSRTSVEQSPCSHRQHGEGPPASTGARGKLMTGGRWVREVRGSTRQRQECQSGEGGVHKLRRCVGRGWPAGVVGSAGRRVGAATLTTGLS